jgi:hypothetical protein
MNIYPLFLASSFELAPERQKLEIFISRQNKRLIKKNVQFSLEIWEDMGAELNNSRKQNDYNSILNKAEIVLVLFWTKMGKFTFEEFDLAYQRFLNTGKPLIYVYEKTAVPSHVPEDWEKKSKEDFLQKLLTQGKEQFQGKFENYGELLSNFQQNLFDLFDQNKLIVGSPAILHTLKAPHSPSFVIGRENELEIISEKLSKKGNVVLISGEGGMGKTTLASKYWHENKYTYGHCAYLFCDQGILNAMMDDGFGLELQGQDEQEKIRQIQRKLNGFGDEIFLLLDNANDPEDIQRFLRLFSGFNGNVLITSRCREVLANSGNEILLGHLTEEDAKSLFLKYYQEDHPEFEELLNQLLKAIDYHTLLIEVFSKNLKKASARGIDMKTFLEAFKEKGLLLERKANTRLETDYTFHINRQMATPNDILEALYDFSDLNEGERYYLVNIALLPIDGYQQQFLLEMFESEDENLMYDALESLYQKGWIGGTYDSLRLSPVVQQLVLHRNQESLWEYGKKLVKKVDSLINYEVDKDNALSKFKWVPFGKHLAKSLRDCLEEDFSFFLNKLGVLLEKLGGIENLLSAKEYLEKAIENSINRFGEDSSQAAARRSNLALVLRDLGGENNLIKAGALLEKSLSSDLKNFGEDSYQVAIRRSNLALLYKDLGGVSNLKIATDLLQAAILSDHRNFGEDSTSLARSKTNLAAVLEDLGGKDNLIAAKCLLEQALSTYFLKYGEGSPSAVTVSSNLAIVLKALGGVDNLLEAKFLQEKSLASDITNFGEESPQVAIRLSNLAMVLHSLGDRHNLIAAKKNLELAIDSYILNFGVQSPVLATMYSNLAMVLQDFGDYPNLLQAKEYLNKSLSLDLKNFGENSPSVAKTCSNLALLYRDLGGEENLLLAKQLLEKALASDLRNFGVDSTLVAKRSSNLALVLKDLGGEENLLVAKGLLERALVSDIRNFGEDSTQVAKRYTNLAAIYQDLGGEDNLLLAKDFLEKSLVLEIKNSGDNSTLVAITYSNLATVLKNLGGEANLLEAKAYLEKALACFLMHFEEYSDDVSKVRSNLAIILKELGNEDNLKEARRLYQEVLTNTINFFGEDSPQAANLYTELGLIYKELRGEDNLLEAAKYFEKAIASDIRNFGLDSFKVALGFFHLAVVLTMFGDRNNLLMAKEYFENAENIFLEKNNEESPIIRDWLEWVNQELEELD